jgi:hypothetical protein
MTLKLQPHLVVINYRWQFCWTKRAPQGLTLLPPLQPLAGFGRIEVYLYVQIQGRVKD